MARFTIMRTEQAMPDERALETVRGFLFGVLNGFTKEDRRAWNGFWKRAVRLEPGEMFTTEMVFPRSGPFHRRHMKIEQSVFEAQERFDHFDQFRYWLKVGSG